MRTGLETLLSDGNRLERLRHQRVGVLAHAASVTQTGEHIIFALRKESIDPARIFAPEHGLWGAAQDMEGVDHGYDEIVERDIVSLYGHCRESLKPEDSVLDNLDAVIIDVQDVGARYYTFAYTALFLAQAALTRGLEVIVIDRPNPINAETIEGNLIDPAYHSFVGMRSSMTRHGMTIGEMLTMWCTTENTPNLQNLYVSRMADYDRRQYYDETGCYWAMPSPNMPNIETAIIYPGMCLIEGTTLSEGRGTTRPFEIFGAPWVRANEVLSALNMLSLPGVSFRPLDFKPMFQKHAHKVCHGLEMHVTNRQTFRPVLTGIAIVGVMHALHEEFAWRTETYEFENDRLAIDLLFGNDRIRKAIEHQENPYRIVERFEAETESWRAQRADFLSYK
ncbi:MAG: DUF1343 domain-containing protein [Proteobacteria bacterium]|nr:DUF1343 domain-containing protein [Pseudomonadota bacterium]